MANLWPWAAAQNGLLARWPSNVLFSELNEENGVPIGTWRPGTANAPGTRPAAIAAKKGYAAPALQRVLEVAARSRQPSSLKKLIAEGAAATKKVHCGVLIDGVAETASMPPEKIPDARRAVERICKGGRWVDRLVVQKAAGTLGHLGQCSAFARRHLRSFYRAFEAPGKRVRRTAAMAEDARWWRDVWATGDADGEPFNGTTYWPKTGGAARCLAVRRKMWK